MSHNNFNWIIPNKLASCHSPTPSELKEFHKQNINTIVCLQTCETNDRFGDYDTPTYRISDVKKLGMQLFSIPVEDDMPPHDEQMNDFVSIVDNPKNKVLVHCHAGIGRSGCMLAAYIGRKYNLDGLKAIEKLHDIDIKYIANELQMIAVIKYLDDFHEHNLH